MYARSGIPEAWLVDLTAGRIEVYRQPGPDGYAGATTHARGERITLLVLPDVTVSVEELIGP